VGNSDRLWVWRALERFYKSCGELASRYSVFHQAKSFRRGHMIDRTGLVKPAANPLAEHKLPLSGRLCSRLVKSHLLEFICLAGMICFWGCGRSHRSSTSNVTGRVTIDRQPVEEGRIVFESANQRPASGKIKDGKIIDMTTYTTGDGAPIGHHQVAIFISEKAKSAIVSNPGDHTDFDPRSMSGESLIPARYNNPQSSGLSAEVTARGENHFEFDIQSK